MGAAVCGKTGYPPKQRNGGSPPLLWGQAQGGYLPFFFFAFFANVLASFSWKMDGRFLPSHVRSPLYVGSPSSPEHNL